MTSLHARNRQVEKTQSSCGGPITSTAKRCNCISDDQNFVRLKRLHNLKSSLAHAEGENKVKMSKREKRTIVIGPPPN
ncbi:WD repeat-containing protein [Daphnia magna]|uniref:WD repeat-containing protein n=1 Tax=Daphnia magna TaxID=35525 RepID=A0A164PC66_9CRUS|nr:WD repeat-containing protein [Daphnia magna]